MGLDKMILSTTVIVAVVELAVLYCSLNRKKIKLSKIERNLTMMTRVALVIITLVGSASVIGYVSLCIPLLIVLLLAVGISVEIIHNASAKLENHLQLNDFHFIPKYQVASDKWEGVLKSKNSEKEIEAECLIFSELYKDVAVPATVFIEFNSLGWITKLYCAQVEEDGQGET